MEQRLRRGIESNSGRCHTGGFVAELHHSEIGGLAQKVLGRKQVRHLNVGVGIGVGFHPAGVKEEGILIGETLNVGEGPSVCSAIDMGNPHLVMFVKDAEKARVSEVGPLMEHHKMFPDRANIEFAQVLDRKHIRMRVWERGSGITFACGTGACATAVASAMQGYTDADGCDVIMDGGTLTVQWDPETKEVLMTGAAEFVFEGTVTE